MITMRKNILLIILLVFTQQLSAQFTISSNHRYLLKNNKPFFWLGDTGWELFHRLNREEAGQYLKRRSEQGFTVIQAVVLAEMDGLHKANAYGQTPFTDDDPGKPNEKYFEHVDYIIDKAAEYNMSIALLPTWGDKIFKDRWGSGPEIFNETNAAQYAAWIAKRYKDKKNIIWVLGGDRNPRNGQDVAIWRSMGNAIMKATDDKAIITFHPQPNQLGSAQWFNDDKWLAFNMFQNGHCRGVAMYDKISTVYNLATVKPVIDAEPIYEDHPVCFNAKDLGTSSAYDVRMFAYLELFAGAHGHTYGCHDIWQFYSSKNEPVNGPHYFWQEALELPGANQMIYVKRLMEAYPITERVPDQSLIKEASFSPAEHIQATRGDDYCMVYSAAGKPFTIVSTKIKSNKIRSYWYDPRNGKSTDIILKDEGKNQQFIPPTSGYGQDWVLVIDDASKGYPKP